MGIEFKEDTTNRLSFRYRGRKYVLFCVTSNAAISSLGDTDPESRFIFLVNRRDWIPPSSIKKPIIFDVTRNRADRSRDEVDVELCRFMKRYYGLWFEYE